MDSLYPFILATTLSFNLNRSFPSRGYHQIYLYWTVIYPLSLHFAQLRMPSFLRLLSFTMFPISHQSSMSLLHLFQSEFIFLNMHDQNCTLNCRSCFINALYDDRNISLSKQMNVSIPLVFQRPKRWLMTQRFSMPPNLVSYTHFITTFLEWVLRSQRKIY